MIRIVLASLAALAALVLAPEAGAQKGAKVISGEWISLGDVAPVTGDAVPGNPSAPGYGRLVQGALETSNVNIVAEITNLITAQRAYEMNSKVISTTDQMMTTTSQLR